MVPPPVATDRTDPMPPPVVILPQLQAMGPATATALITATAATVAARG